MIEFGKSALLEDLTLENEDAEKKGWGIYDSGLVSGDHPLDFDFAKLYPSGHDNIRVFLEREYQKKKGKMVGIEIGGSGSRLFSDFSPGFIQKSLGLTLFDLRDSGTKVRDQKINHMVMTGDAFKPETYSALRRTLGGESVDLLFERMENGLLGFPEDLADFKQLLVNWYLLLSEGGVMFVQSPYILNMKNIEEYTNWLESIQKKTGSNFVNFTLDASRFYIKIKRNINLQLD